jgi:hypothetical protein
VGEKARTRFQPSSLVNLTKTPVQKKGELGLLPLIPVCLILLRSPLGTQTRSAAWNNLVKDNLVKDKGIIDTPQHKIKAALKKALHEIDSSQWAVETDMYPDIIKAMRTVFKRTKVFDTHARGDFRPDVSVGDFEDERLPYFMQYFIEFTLPTTANLLSSETCGQVVDYFYALHEKQPYRREFLGILSNFNSAWIFTAEFEDGPVSVIKRSALDLADAIIYANVETPKQIKHPPHLDKRFGPEYAVLSVSKHHFLLDLSLPILESTAMTSAPTAPAQSTRRPRNQKIAQSAPEPWRPPSRYHLAKRFVLKVTHDNADTANELKFLKEIRDVDCRHLPELVWSPTGERQFGIVPLGKSIDFQRPAFVSRNIVTGLVDGLQCLHKMNIVHRDIRPSNLVFNDSGDVVIIDFETAVHMDNTKHDYRGGYLCWPKRLLESGVIHYTPNAVDDLRACILVVLHMLFPSHFDSFHASGITVCESDGKKTEETEALLEMLGTVEKSVVWRPFVTAAEELNYEKLKSMADVFCHV